MSTTLDIYIYIYIYIICIYVHIYTHIIVHVVSIWRPRDSDSTQGVRKVPTAITNVHSIQQDYIAQNWEEGHRVEWSVMCQQVLRYLKGVQRVYEKRKARIVARGFEQRKGVDFFQSFCPTASQVSLRLVLALTASLAFCQSTSTLPRPSSVRLAG
jgi:hypothetical protein